MQKLSLAFLVAAAGIVSSGCATTSWVNGVSISPDGNRVDVVGAQMMQVYGGWMVDKPLRWVCLRDGRGVLTCNHMTKELPTMED